MLSVNKITKVDEECNMYRDIASNLCQSMSEEDRTKVLTNACQSLSIPLPWKGDFDEFMSDSTNCLNFE